MHHLLGKSGNHKTIFSNQYNDCKSSSKLVTKDTDPIQLNNAIFQ